MDHPRFGRRGACYVFFGGITISIGAGAFWPKLATYSSIIGNFVAMCAFNLVYVQAAELFPTRLRSGGMGICSAAGKVGSFFSAPLHGILGSTATLTIISSMCALAVLAAASGLPETRGRGLTDHLPGGDD